MLLWDHHAVRVCCQVATPFLVVYPTGSKLSFQDDGSGLTQTECTTSLHLQLGSFPVDRWFTAPHTDVTPRAVNSSWSEQWWPTKQSAHNTTTKVGLRASVHNCNYNYQQRSRNPWTLFLSAIRFVSVTKAEIRPMGNSRNSKLFELVERAAGTSPGENHSCIFN